MQRKNAKYFFDVMQIYENKVVLPPPNVKNV